VIVDSERLRPHRREDLITMISDLEYDPGAKCPKYDDFLLKICCNDTSLVDYLDRIDGYCLTGEVREELGFLEDGEGSNGKTTRSNIQRKLGGDYAGVTNANNLIAKQFDGHPTVLAVLERLRRVTAEEFPDGGRLDMARWKKLVNRGRLPAHRMHEDERDFELTFKINLEVNTLPRIDEIDTGSWRRICVLPFRLDLRKEGIVNTKIEDDLVAELPGILARTVRGCVAWQQRGLAVDVPACVIAATAVYRTDEDLLAGFIADYCDCGLAYDEAAAALYRAFKDWSKQNGVVNPWSKKKFGQRLKARFEPTTDGYERKWKGLRLKPATAEAIEERQIAGMP
jgi:putative DNA primase/helicase